MGRPRKVIAEPEVRMEYSFDYNLRPNVVAFIKYDGREVGVYPWFRHLTDMVVSVRFVGADRRGPREYNYNVAKNEFSIEYDRATAYAQKLFDALTNCHEFVEAMRDLANYTAVVKRPDDLEGEIEDHTDFIKEYPKERARCWQRIAECRAELVQLDKELAERKAKIPPIQEELAVAKAALPSVRTNPVFKKALMSASPDTRVKAIQLLGAQ